MAYQPLRGIRVLDLTNVLAGPFACHQLAHMGADVIKVEARGSGDLARQLGADLELNKAHMGVSFLAQNPGKRSITVDFKHTSGKAVFRKLVRGADVVVENFRPGVMARLGLGYDALLKENPKLIYCAISGFGQDGPLRDLPAYDQIIQGMSGVMSITGAPENAPYRVGYPVADTIGGITAAFAVAAALADRDRTAGAFIDVVDARSRDGARWAGRCRTTSSPSRTPTDGQRQRDGQPVGHVQDRRRPAEHRANKQEQFEAVAVWSGTPSGSWMRGSADRHARLHTARN